MLDLIDNLLNRITMYRLVLYYLIFLLVVAAIFGYFGILSYTPINLVFSTAVLVAISWITNWIFAKVFKAQTNVESVYITALILALIISPVALTDFNGIMFLFWAAAIAMASKYILAIGKKHIFNPAALSVAVTAIILVQSATWWIAGSIPMLLCVIAGGWLITRKIQRSNLVLTFLGVALATIVGSSSANPLTAIQSTLLHTPLFFFAFVMLTEPLTTPPTELLQILYGAIVGVLFAPAIHFGSFYLTPELALIAGNIFSYAVSPKRKYVFTLKAKEHIGAGIYDFVFTPDKKMYFHPGQYMEWTLGHSYADSRGNRRYFTLASSPTENEAILGIKVYDKLSSFKKQLLALNVGDTIVAGQCAGDFTLPRDKKKKLVFIAGGIGITPFRSMIKYLLNKKEARSITLLYSNNTAEEIAYNDVFDQAELELGIKTVYTLTSPQGVPPSWTGQTGFFNERIIAKEVPDYDERTFYISGPRSMVVAFENTLKNMGIDGSQIITDFFPGYA